MLSDGSYLSTVFDSQDSQRRAGQIVRVIDYTLHDSATPVQDSYRLVTNILEPEQAPALELAALPTSWVSPGLWAAAGLLAVQQERPDLAAQVVPL